MSFTFIGNTLSLETLCRSTTTVLKRAITTVEICTPKTINKNAVNCRANF